MSKGLFITLEGVEGAGKTTQAKMLAEWLSTLGLPVLETREPGAGEVCGQIRAVLLNPANTELAPMTEALLLAADRAQHVAETLRPALEQGKIIVCDRYADSFFAYQGYGRGLDMATLTALNAAAAGGLAPDITLLLELPPEAGLARTKLRGASDRMEQEQMDFHRRLSDGYRKLAEQNPQRIKRINAAQAEARVQADMRAALAPLLRERGLVQDAVR